MSQSFGPCNEEPECTICGSSKLEVSDGLFFCSECGTQSQDVREEFAEETERTSAVRTYKSSTAKKQLLARDENRSEDITFIEKIQHVLKLQCDALIKLGFDESVKEAVRCLSLIYLKHFGYAFQGKPSPQATPTSCRPKYPSNTVTPIPEKRRRKPRITATPTRTREQGSRKRLRVDDEVCSSSSKRSKLAAPTQVEGPEPSAQHSDKRDIGFLSDSCLFEPSVEDIVDDKSDFEEEERDIDPEDLFGDDLHKYYKVKKRGSAHYLSIRLTISLLYLGLLFSNQKVLLCDITRLIATNKIPFHNLHMMLPEQYTARKSDMLRMYGRFQVTSDKLHAWSFLLLGSLPVPPLPPFDPRWVCHTLVDRLTLPLCFHAMLDRTLATVYLPCHHERLESLDDNPATFIPRVDVECLALMVVLLKLVYRLDDKYEYEMSAGHTFQGEEDGRSLYVWEDWVTMFCRQQQQTLDQAVPLTARELEYVSDYNKYLDFCREDLFPKVRPVRSKGDRHRVYNPQRFAKVAAIFGQHVRNLRTKASVGGKVARKEMYSWDTFTPQRIPLDALEEGDVSEPWSRYLATPDTMDSKTAGKEFQLVSDSMVLLLQLCSDVVDVRARNLLCRVRQVEWSIISRAEVPVAPKLSTSSSEDVTASLHSSEDVTASLHSSDSKGSSSSSTQSSESDGGSCSKCSCSSSSSSCSRSECSCSCSECSSDSDSSCSCYSPHSSPASSIALD